MLLLAIEGVVLSFTTIWIFSIIARKVEKLTSDSPSYYLDEITYNKKQLLQKISIAKFSFATLPIIFIMWTLVVFAAIEIAF